jgi:hypothetical protein
MDLSFLLTTVTLIILGYAGVTWLNSAYIAPRRAATKAAVPVETVKSKRRLSGFRKGSGRVQRSEPLNAGSTHQEAKKEPVNVQPNVQRSAEIAPEAPPAGAISPAGDTFTLTAVELMQLTDAIHQRREGATVEEAISKSFGVTKGGSEGYRRAKAIWDAANTAPGAAPAGTYAPLVPPAKRRRAARGQR